MSAGTLADRPPDLSVERIEPWLAGNVPDLAPPLRSSLVAGGRSNLTYRVTDAAGRSVALRRPPARTEVRGAHDVAREYRVQRALRARSRVRVPDPIAFCGDTDVIGVPFYVMDFVDGTVVRDAVGAATLPAGARQEAALAVVDELVELHRTEPDRVGLADLGRPAGYLERQLRRWSGRIDGDPATVASLTEGHVRLVRRMPPQRRSTLLHGDYRLDNVILSGAGEVMAVLDWELSTRGDPLTDLGWLLLYWQPDADLAEVLPRGSEQPGFPPEAVLAERYAEATGADISDLPYYIGFAAWRLAIITLGVSARYRGAARAGSDADPDRLAGDALRLAAAALRHLA